MGKLLKLKNKPFWLVSALLLVFAAAFYQQGLKEGFEDANLKTVGIKLSINMSKMPIEEINKMLGTSNSIKLILDASDGKELWKVGGTANFPDSIKTYIWIYEKESPAMTKSQVEEGEKNENANPTKMVTEYKFINFVCLSSDGKYIDKNGSSVIGSTKIGDYNVNTIVLWVVVGIIGLIILFVLFRVFSGGSQPTTTNNSRISQNSY